MAKGGDAGSAGQGSVVARVFDAPREMVFKAWTEPDRLKRWWGPKGFSTPFCAVDLREGGVFLYCMRSPETGLDTALELVESRATANGVILQVYRTAGRPQYG